MKRHMHGSLAVGLFLVIALLASTAVPGHAQHGGDWHGGGGGWHRGWWGPGWGYPYYGYPYPYTYPYPYGYPAYSPPVVEGSPQTYIQQEAPAQQSWYYCQDPQGYYPYVRECPGGWQQVAPQPPPPPR